MHGRMCDVRFLMQQAMGAGFGRQKFTSDSRYKNLTLTGRKSGLVWSPPDHKVKNLSQIAR